MWVSMAQWCGTLLKNKIMKYLHLGSYQLQNEIINAYQAPVQQGDLWPWCNVKQIQQQLSKTVTFTAKRQTTTCVMLETRCILHSSWVWDERACTSQRAERCTALSSSLFLKIMCKAWKHSQKEQEAESDWHACLQWRCRCTGKWWECVCYTAFLLDLSQCIILWFAQKTN